MKIYLTEKTCMKFIKKTLGYEEPILINKTVNAKSLFSIMSLSLPNNFNVEILSSNLEHINKFEKDMEEFYG